MTITDYTTAQEDVLSYFLTEFPSDSQAAYVEDVVKKFLEQTYAPDWIDQFWDGLGQAVISDLLDEYNRRIIEGFPVHFTFVDDEGRIVKGWTDPSLRFNTALFQRALLSLSDTEFERLSARLLHLAGCTDAWATPASHDQGLDGFGRLPVLESVRGNVGAESKEYWVWLVVQAKHYKKERVRSSEIREFVGSTHLAQLGIYAQEGKKYELLDWKPYTPRGLVFVTSGEVKRTSRLLADRTGIAMLTSSDLCAAFSTYWINAGEEVPESISELTSLLRYEAERVPLAR